MIAKLVATVGNYIPDMLTLLNNRSKLGLDAANHPFWKEILRKAVATPEISPAVWEERKNAHQPYVPELFTRCARISRPNTSSKGLTGS
jgi:hypothetical protein